MTLSVQNTIHNLPASAPIYLNDTALTASDPNLWFASLLPEGDSAEESVRANRAIDLLTRSKGCGAVLQSLVLQVERDQSNEAIVADEWQELERRTKECADRDGTSYGVQLALDTLAQKQIADENQEGY